MPGWARKDDSHSCGAIATQYSPNVYADKLNVHRKGDEDCHPGPCGCAIQDQASPNVYANNKRIARCGDNHSGDLCHPPSPHNQCSTTTFANG